MMFRLILAAAGLCCGSAAQAQTLTAQNPEGIAAAMKAAGYEAELSTDTIGDPKIDTELGGYRVAVLFYGCDEQTHQGCDSVQFSTGFDRETPMDPARALHIAREWRFLSVSLDDEGDPYLRWDILTGSGIPQAVLMSALRRYGEALDDASTIIFEDE